MDINKGTLWTMLGIATSATALLAGYTYFTSEPQPAKSRHKARSHNNLNTNKSKSNIKQSED